MKENAEQLIEAGVDGLNIGDGFIGGELSSIEDQEEKIVAIKELKHDTSINYTTNARTCALLHEIVVSNQHIGIDINRGNAYA